ncbi:hypothetical protein BpHYR1_014281 [Brachionus plicatilis]|uniref:Uncharacterized protein n=1 Tax=Brachionus plicatilis TaxID=10195 RepID=A0A3M7R5X8_BRAPC|nr:hypothetical protein BpHYR1_014281 [Brachionus plicatilis]
MNKNKQKYVSVPQDSFKFEHLDRFESQVRPVSSINYDARINEICLAAAENESIWVRYKSFYTKTELATVIIGTTCSALALTTVLVVLYWSHFCQLMQLIPDPLFQHPYFYPIVEILSLVLDLAKIFSIKHTWDMLSLEIDSDIQDDGTAIAEAAQKLKTRCIIRQKLKEIQSLLFYLNIFVYIYLILFVVVVKYSLAIYLSVNYSYLIEVDVLEFCNETSLYEGKLCAESAQSDVATFLIFLVVFLYVTSSIKLIVQTISVLNFKNVLGFYLIEKFSDTDMTLWSEYEECKNKLFMNDINDRIEESQAYLADKLFNLNKKDSHYINEQEPEHLNESLDNAIRLIDEINHSNS